MTKLHEVPSDVPDNGNEDDAAPASPFAALREEAPKTITRRATKAPAKEPTMAGLRRVLGDSVLDVFPPELRDAVDRAYVIWQTNPDSYLPTPFDTEQDKLDSLVVMRAYAECAPKGPYTIRTISDDDPKLLVWRAQNRRGSSAE
jgi:hypothetical protein